MRYRILLTLILSGQLSYGLLLEQNSFAYFDNATKVSDKRKSWAPSSLSILRDQSVDDDQSESLDKVLAKKLECLTLDAPFPKWQSSENFRKRPTFSLSHLSTSDLLRAEEIAIFFLKRERELVERDGKHTYLQKNKLQYLLFIAQYWHITLYKKPLYGGVIIMVRGVPCICNPLDTYNDSRRLRRYSRSIIERMKYSNRLTNQQNRLLTGILKRFLTASVKEMTQKYYGINSDRLEEHFGGLDEWSSMVLTMLIQGNLRGEAYDEFIDIVREHLSFNSSPQFICRFAAQMVNQKEVLEPLIGESGSIRYRKWQHQSQFEGCMAHLFFPVQLEQLYESPSTVCGRLPVQYLIAFSSRFRNPLALFYLKETLESICEEEHEVIPGLIQMMRGYVKEPEGEQREPALFTALLCLALYREDLARRYFVLGSEQNDPWCTYHYIMRAYFVRSEELRPLLDKLEGTHSGLFNIVQARLADSVATRIASYRSAGENGIAYGSLLAAQLLHKKLVEDDDVFGLMTSAPVLHKLLNNAATKVPEAASILQAQYCEDHKYLKAQSMCELREKVGDLLGYGELGLWYLKQGRNEEAQEMFIKAGIDGYALRANSVTDQATQIQLSQEYMLEKSKLAFDILGISKSCVKKVSEE